MEIVSNNFRLGLH